MDFPLLEVERGGYTISSHRARLNISAIHDYLRRCYWSPGIPRETVEQAVKRSLCFGLYHGGTQVGLARVVTDGATFAYLCDVYVLEEHQGRGLGKWLMEVVLSHPSLQDLRRFMLATRDAHGLYQQFGFEPLAAPERFMEILVPDVYQQQREPRD